MDEDQAYLDGIMNSAIPFAEFHSFDAVSAKAIPFMINVKNIDTVEPLEWTADATPKEGTGCYIRVAGMRIEVMESYSEVKITLGLKEVGAI